MEFRLLVRGDRACFRRPEFAEDLVSYDVITPRAAREVFEATYTAPGLCWRIDEIHVLAPLRSTWMALTEVERGADLPAIAAGQRDRRMAHVLCDVAYVVTAHPEPHAGDDLSQAFRDRVVSARFVRPPVLGHRSFPSEITLLEAEDALPPGAWASSGAVDLGWTLHDVGESGGPRFYRPTMIDGVIDLRRRKSLILAG